MTAKHPGWLVAKVFAERLVAVTEVIAKPASLTFKRLAAMAKNSEKFYVAISPEEVTRTVANRRKATGSVQFVLEVRIAKHTGTDTINNDQAEEQFFNMVQQISDAVLGLTDLTPEGQDIVLEAPWGTVQWPTESLEVPTDEDLSAFSIRDRTIQFTFNVMRQGA